MRFVADRVNYHLKQTLMRINLVGGFLGSGKTTAIARASRFLMSRNEVVGVITNDQGVQQVDTAMMKHLGIPSREVAGSCFCCNFDQFDAHVQSLAQEHLPTTIFAESVGTCTDLVATIVRPLALYRPEITVAISVFADAAFLVSLLEGTSLFVEESVRYIYRKQLEEADLIVINKSDLITSRQRETITAMMAAEYPDKPFLFQNSMQEEDISQWIDTLGQVTGGGRMSLDLDYDIYGEGEAKMAWLDKHITIIDDNMNAVIVARKILEGTFRRIREEGVLIGHLKFFVDGTAWSRKVSFTSTSHDFSGLPDDPAVGRIDLLINARVQTDPAWLTRVVDEVVSKSVRENVEITAGEWSAFVPGYPRPTHRMN